MFLLGPSLFKSTSHPLLFKLTVLFASLSVNVPTLQTIMISSYYYKYRENIRLGVKLTPA